ncbi:DUF2157 domain-containing protein [Nostoc sp. 'Peltigera membranacea cyanobiont' 213]|uniref:DUF2157 domain-containing protein n=1 Tax=Nostoc sp. 'Peltigera membranacea cyanobiont' 213 TaxID=2014530 RepID=UPI000B953C71|nr:DUF2157 domain-containing protein [Nostoc sp. 'Peltigera membranacea cyanobiont' 213]OYD91763.1 DUF2157 domain-containing protein [Nostoc sp. 'Peltigera membranacea cyanobiont' 213]
MKIYQEDLDWAVSQGLITAEQANALWNALSVRNSERPQFNFANVTFYFGALIVISAMTWFMTLAWESFGGSGIFLLASIYALCFVLAGSNLWWRQEMKIPGGLLFTIAVSLTPLAIYGLQRTTGFWTQGDPGTYQDFYLWIKGSWFLMELGTIIAGLVAINFVRFPFLTAPIAFSLYFMSMDITPLLFGEKTYNWQLRLLVSLWFGIACIVVAYLVDIRTRRRDGDYSFWLYLFGLLAFWFGLTLMGDSNEFQKFLYCLINLGLMLLSVLLKRKVFIVFGGMGVFSYLGHLAYSVFQNAVLFPFALTVLGISMIYLGTLYQRNSRNIELFLERLLPDTVRRLLPRE